jgi:uncharacterized membrane protein
MCQCFFLFSALSLVITKKYVYEIYNYGKIVFLFYYFPVTFQFIIASQYYKCKRSDTKRSIFKMFLLCLAECLLIMFKFQVLQLYVSGNLQSYTYKPAIFKVIMKLLPLQISLSIPAECCYLNYVTFLASVRRQYLFQMLRLIAYKATPYCKNANTTNNVNSSGKSLRCRNALIGR